MPDGRPKLVEMTLGHRTKAEKAMRKEAEQALYTGENFTESRQVKENDTAHKEFIRLKRLYSKIAFVDALDQQVINRYCLEVSNIDTLNNMLIQMESMLGETDDTDKKLEIYNQINRTMAAMQKSKELLLKYEDRLFLNPATRVKSIPKTPAKQVEPSGMAKYLQKRADVQ